MTAPLPFEVIFSSPDGAESRIASWTQAGGVRYPIWNGRDAVHTAVVVSVRDNLDDSYVIKVMNYGDASVSGWWGVRRKWRYTPRSYTLVPGVFYNGNQQERLNGLPVLDLPESPVYQLPLSAASMPAVLYGDFEGDGGFTWLVSPCSIVGYNGVEFDGAAETMTIWMPAKEDRVYRYGSPEDYGREPCTLQPHQALSLLLTMKRLQATEPTDVFDACWRERTQLRVGFPQFSSPAKMSLREAAELVGHWMMERHFVRGDHGEPMLLNAFMDIGRANGPVREKAEWNVMIGWCSGPMTALPFLKLNGATAQAATEYLDFLCYDGFFPSGLKKPIFDGSRWIDLSERPEYSAYEHVRLYGDFAYYLGRCIRFEASQGKRHPEWERVFSNHLAIFSDIWRRNGDFGMLWSTDTIVPQLRRDGTAAGAFPFLALAEGLRHHPNDQLLRRILPEIAQAYAKRVLKTGRSNGGPLDIQEADDSESIAALADAYIACYELIGDEGYLEYALQAAKLFASWVMAYRPVFPPASALAELDVSGGVIANVQNRHVGPGICTNSGAFLKKLARYAHEPRWEALQRQIVKAAINCVCMDEKEFPGMGFDGMAPFAAGMVSEQINVSDALNFAGESWSVSASWPATALLLHWFDHDSEEEPSEP